MRCNSAVSATIALPSASDPASPMKTRAGNQLKSRNATTAPASATASSATGSSLRETATIAMPTNASAVHDAASPSDAVGQVDRIAGRNHGDGNDYRKPPAEIRRTEPGKELMREAGDRQADADEHPGDALQAQLLPDGEPETADVADVDDVVETTGDRTGDQGEDHDEARARAVDREPGHDRDEAEQHATERWSPLLRAVAGRAVRGDVLPRAEANEQADERGIEHHAGDEREHADDDRLSHGSIRQSAMIISAICFQIGAARMEPNRLLGHHLRVVQDDHHRELRVRAPA